MISLFEGQITDILPAHMASDPEIIALSYAISNAERKFFDRINQSMVMLDVDSLPEAILDERAAELNTAYYDASLPVEKKRQLIKSTIRLYQKAGTPAAVREMIEHVFGSGEVLEWFNAGDEPGTFQILTTEPIAQGNIDLLNRMLARVKNASSTLKAIKTGQKLEAQTYIAASGIYAMRIIIK